LSKVLLSISFLFCLRRATYVISSSAVLCQGGSAIAETSC